VLVIVASCMIAREGVNYTTAACFDSKVVI
jgi:hypothetical protein